ncbi:hypothetical protein [Streptomyces sp. NBC_00199]|uniref:hypothetical protein n=1 Tax=Streptomyces sp. NBC_00199 TaxID=2975678 RepID=UPI00225AA6DF|nr:hypothetical protein [Streptomyces sp. NBC_00199]MCX5265814.1 hypothetical protein [Streptomyces sp. NBC_00199]
MGGADRPRHHQCSADRPWRLGPETVLFAPDVVGTAEQILKQLAADPVPAQVSELRLELPYEFHREEYEQILHHVRQLIAPELGWRPASPAVETAGR